MDRMPPEIFSEILKKQSAGELTASRLTNRKWSHFATNVLRNIQQPLIFNKQKSFDNFISTIENSGEVLPFVKFKFDLRELTGESVLEFLRKFGSDVEEYHLGWNVEAVGNIPTGPGEDNQRKELGQILMEILLQSRNLKSLKFNTVSLLSFPIKDIQSLRVFPYLRVLEFNFCCEVYVHGEELLVETLIAQSPSLQELHLTFPSHALAAVTSDAGMLGKLPQLLKKTPPRIKLGLSVEWTKQEKKLLQELMGIRTNLIFCRANFYPTWPHLKDKDKIDKEVIVLFWTWIVSHSNSLRKVSLLYVFPKELVWPLFPNCTELEMCDPYPWEWNSNFHLGFRNVWKLTLYGAKHHSLKFAALLPVLQVLIIEHFYNNDGWEAITGEVKWAIEEELENFVLNDHFAEDRVIGIINPLQQMQGLKKLQIVNWNWRFMWGIIYFSLRNKMQHLDQLAFGIDDTVKAESLLKYKWLLGVVNHKIVSFSKLGK